jgi:hypothetical protein
MATEICVRIVPGGMMAVNLAEASKLDELLGKEGIAKFTRPRNYEFHKKYFQMLKTTLDMVDLQINMRQWRWMVLVGIGHCEYIEHCGMPIPIPKSINFASVDDSEFEQIYTDSIDFICTNYLEQKPAELRQLLEFL